MAAAIAAGSGFDDDLHGVMLVSIPRAAELLDVSRAQIYNLIAQGKLRSVKINKSRRIEIAEIKRVIAAHRVEG